MTGRRSAILAPVRLPPALEAIRLAHVSNARLGVPAHVTLLFPFMPPADIDRPVLRGLAAAIARTPAFDVGFTEVRHWDPGPAPEGVVWLPPDPGGPFIAMTHALVEAFPAYLPYEGLHDEVIPHVTLADVDVDIAAIEGEACWRVPFRRRVTAAALLVEDDDGRWRTARRLYLG